MKKRILSMIIAIVMVVGLVPSFAIAASAAEIVASQPANGDGSAENPYQITTVGELYWFAYLVNTKAKDGGNNNAHAKLMNNITVNENVIVDGALTSDTSSLNVWTAMGKTVFSSGWFGGSFDGNGKTISGLYVNGTANYQGFIGCLGEGASVKNLTIKDSYFTSTSSSLGAFVGTMGLSSAAENPVIENCKLIDSVVSGTGYVGGIVGGGDYGEIISNCHVYNCTITGTEDNVGGIAGSAGDYNNEAYIRLCSVNDSSVSGANNVGGILGKGGRSTKTKISACCNYNTSVSATTKNAGGILGADAACYSCFVTAKVSAPSKQGPFYGSGNSYNSAYDSDVYGESKLFTNSMAFTTEEIEAGVATYYLTDTTASSAVYVLWGQKIGEDKYPSWNPDSNPDYIVYRMDDTENGGYIYYNGDAAAEYEPNEDGIYEIADRSDWYKFAKKAKEDPSIDGILTANIDFTGVASNKMANYVIGVTGKAYTGTFNGNGYSVINLPEVSQSLFNAIGNDGELKNLNLSGAVLTNMDAVCVAGLVYNNLGVISNVTVTDVTVSSGAVAAGIVVDNRGTVTGCTISDITVTGKTAAGGIAGINHSGNTIEDCHVVSGTVKSVGAEYDAVAGGICGSSYGGTIEGCTNNADVSAEAGRLETAAGIVGRPNSYNDVSVKIIKCSNTGNINGTWAGGISGADLTATYVNISLCYNEGAVTGSAAGGIAANGSINAEDLIVNCYNAGEVNAVGTRAMAGGIVGKHSNNTIKNCHNYGKVTSEYVAAPISCTDVGVWPGADELINNHAIEGNIDAPNISPYLDTEGAESSLDAIVVGSTREAFVDGTITAKLNESNSETVWYQYTEYPILEERHMHQWSYTLEGTDTIKAECTQTGCDLENNYGGKVSIAAPTELLYDGESKDAVCSYTDWLPAKADVVYSIDRVNVTGQDIEASLTYGEATVSVSYQIAPRELAASMVTISLTSPTYNGTEKTATVTVKYNTSTTLTAGTHYEVTGTTAATEIGTYTVTVTGKGNYSGTVGKTWNITKGSLSAGITIEGWTYGDTPNVPTVSNNPENAEVTYTYYISTGRRLTMTGTANGAETEGGVPTYAGTYYVGAVIAETEHYSETTITPARNSFTISPKEVTNPAFEGLQATYSYANGNEIKPVFTLKDDLGNVIPESEYTITYSDNTDIGEATITITDNESGNYTVSGSVTFNIVPHTHNYTYTLAGTDTIKATCSNEDGNCTATEQTIKLVAPSDLVYSGTAKNAAIEGSIDGVELPTISYSGDSKSVGTHTASITLGDVTVSVSFTITECPHESYTDGDCDHCDYVCTHSTMTYNDNGDDTHTKNCPVCQYSASENHDHTNGKCVCGKKATPAYTVPLGIAATYAQTLADVVLPAGFTWQDEPSTPVGNVGTRTFKVTFTPDDTDNYEIVTDIEVTIAVEKATPNVSLTAPIDKVMGGYSIELNPSSDAVDKITFEIIDGDGYSVNGNIITIDDGVVVGTTLTVKYRSVATDNYESVEGEITLTVGVPTVDTSALEDAIAALEGRLESLEAKFGTDGKVTKLRAELDSLKNIVSDLTNDRVTESELGAAISGVNNAVSALAERVKGLEDTYATKAEVNALKQDLNDQYGKLLDLINANTLDIGTINTTLGEIKNTLATLASKTDVATEINRLGELIATLTTRVSNTETNISANAGEISSLKTTVETLATELRGADETLTNSVNELSSALTTLTGRVDTVEQDIAKLKQDLADAINKLYNDIADGDKLNSDALIEAIGDLTALIEAAEKKASDADAEQKTDLLKSIEDAKSAITTAYEKAISDAVAKLEDADKNNSDALAEAIKNLEALIEAAEEAAIAGDNTLSGKITEAITKAENELKAAKESLEALIGGVQSNLDKAKSELDKAIADLDAAMKQGDADLSAEIASLNTALANAKAALEKADADNKAELVSKIETADATLDAAIQQVQSNLDKAKSELDTAIKNGDTALDEKITNLNTALDNAVAALEATDAANKSELEGKITSAQSTLQAAIDEVASDLAAAEKALADAISKGDAALSDSISSVSASLSAAKSALEKADANNKAALEAKIADAEATLDAAIKAVQKNLDDAKTALEKALADGDKANADALAQAISDLNAAIDAAETAAVTADGSLKSELTSKIDNADAALEAAIEALAGELDTVKNALEARDNELQTFIIIVCVISSVALCGSGAFVVWFFIDRKKRI